MFFNSPLETILQRAFSPFWFWNRGIWKENLKDFVKFVTKIKFIIYNYISIFLYYSISIVILYVIDHNMFIMILNFIIVLFRNI
jgi:hypothetical protein